MDTKALAKSKRAHSLHHSKKHNHHQAVKTPSASSGATSFGPGIGSKKPTGKKIGVKPHPSHGSRTLPSNSDRYGEEFHLESEDTAQESTSQPSEFVVPKSKGADYVHLVSEATAQSQVNYSSDSFLLFNDGLEDFTQYFGPLLSAKGQSMLSWIADDNFDFEDPTSTSHEASFLSLNLNDLAQQLAKAKPSERLFLEPDLLPPELLDDESQTRIDEHDQVKTCTPAVAIDSVASSLDHEPVLRSITISEEIPIIPSREGLSPTKKTKDEISELREPVSISPNSLSTHNMDSASGSVPIFEATNAETELDMLLNSFNETVFLQSSSSSTSRIRATATTESVKKGEHVMVSANIDNTIDNLLQETSDMTTFDLPSTSHPSSKSKLLDDFDSWLDTI